jgi:hypothetical protein
VTIQIRPYDDSDYDMLTDWWRAWKWQPIDKGYLSKIGAVCSFEEKDCFAGFLIETNTSFALIEWVISNRFQKSGREECKAALIDFLCHVAKGLGYSAVFVMTPSKNLIKTCQDMGFVGRENLINVVRIL